MKSDCVGNQMRLSLDKALAIGNQLEVEAISENRLFRLSRSSGKICSSLRGPCTVCPLSTDGSQYIVLNPSLAAQCGYSMESDPWGNTRIYTSLMGCYVSTGVCSQESFGFSACSDDVI